ncbi:MAG TPA: AI-2E family transporter [Patescibacteria group bacterium]|nr:AI-2E family transporter [Patescibacteria group bacterium]
MPDRTISISTGIVFRTIFIILALWFLFLIRDVIVLLFVSIILVSAMEPAVDYFQKKKIPRSVTVLIIYLLLIALLSVAISFLVPPMVRQFSDLTNNFAQYSQNFKNSLGPVSNFFESSHINLGTSQILEELGATFSNVGRSIFSKTVSLFSGLLSVVIVFSLAFYMSAKEDGIKNFIISVVPKKHQEYAANLTERIKDKIGRWLLGQLFVMFIIFLLDSVGLYLVGVPFALILGIFAGIMEVIPYVGPIISGIPGVILGFMISPTTGFLAFLVYLIAQLFEGNVVVPQVMKRAVGLNPIAVILALLIGAKLAGVLGAILSIPVATVVGIFVRDIMENKNVKEAA